MLSYIEISKENLLHNFRLFRKHLHPKTRIISVVKANAYGHGIKEVVEILHPEADCFAVDDYEEYKQIRELTDKDILILGYIEKQNLKNIISPKTIIGVYDFERIKLLNQLGNSLGLKPRLHIKIDAVLGRQGVFLKDLPIFLDELKKLENIKVEGIYAHFANIEDTTDFSHAQKQISIYQKAKKVMSQKGYLNFSTHISSTAAALVYEQDLGRNSFVRLGIGQYGLWPSKEIEAKYIKKNFKLMPVLRWITHVAQIKIFPKNYSVGYGLSYKTVKETKVAVIPQGYSDGYDRGLSNLGEVLVKGKKCRVLGRVAMNMFVVDVSHVEDVKVEDEVVLLGNQGKDKITAEELAGKIGTINYEVVARISPLLSRIVK